MSDMPREDSDADAPLRWWSVALVVDEADSRPLSRQEIFDAMHPQGVRRISIGPSELDEPEEVASLKLELQASSATAAQQRAENLLVQARRAADLPDEVPSVAWVNPLTDDPASSVRFLDKAEELLEDEDEQDMAVVAAQIHLEVQIRTILSSAAEHSGPDWADVLLKTRGLGNLNNKLTQALIKALLGIDVKQMPEWEAYKRHNVLRNAIVHEGQDAEEEESRSSVATVRAICIRLANAAHSGDS
jgi:hypothetical protein